MSMKYNAVIFDLDGTLIDTLSDIADAVNFVLQKHNYPVHTEEYFRSCIGGGISQLVYDTLPEKLRADREYVNTFTGLIKEQYNVNWNIKTKPYPGVENLLSELNKMEIPFSVLSNKPHDLTEKSVDFYFRDHTFQEVLGAGKRFPLKPFKEAPLYFAERMAVNPEEILFVGDTAVDMHTAKNASMKSVGVNWGFRPDELIDADYRINAPDDLLRLIIHR